MCFIIHLENFFIVSLLVTVKQTLHFVLSCFNFDKMLRFIVGSGYCLSITWLILSYYEVNMFRTIGRLHINHLSKSSLYSLKNGHVEDKYIYEPLEVLTTNIQNIPATRLDSHVVLKNTYIGLRHGQSLANVAGKMIVIITIVIIIIYIFNVNLLTNRVLGTIITIKCYLYPSFNFKLSSKLIIMIVDT